MEVDNAISDGKNSRFTDVRRVAETGSTNADVMALARQGASEGLVLVADHQTAGRGRAGRTWTAPPGASLLCTVLLRPPAAVAPLVTFALAVAAAEAVEELTGARPGLKWPNDLVVEDAQGRTRKLAGILAEAEWAAGSDAASGARRPDAVERVAVAAGIGLNIAWGDDVPEDLVDILVALDHLSGAVVDRDLVLASLLDRLEVSYGQLVGGDVNAVLDRWRDRSSTLGRRVRVDLGSTELEGVALDITPEGQLIVDPDVGPRRTLAVGDVVHLRASGSD